MNDASERTHCPRCGTKEVDGGEAGFYCPKPRCWPKVARIPSAAEQIEAAVLAEREACAKACEAQNWSAHSDTFAAAIRARGGAE